LERFYVDETLESLAISDTRIDRRIAIANLLWSCILDKIGHISLDGNTV